MKGFGAKIHSVGFTGTQAGMTWQQSLAFIRVLSEQGEAFNFHHGDCIGADNEAHRIIRLLWKKVCIFVYPPIKSNKRAYTVVGSEQMVGKLVVLDEKDYIARNHDIVNACNVLIACPKGEEELRSGTWATVRYARKKMPHEAKRIIIIYPDGGVIR